MFDVRREGNVPTLLAVLTLLATALVAATIATTYHRAAARSARTWGWITAALFFAAIDATLEESLELLGSAFLLRGLFAAVREVGWSVAAARHRLTAGSRPPPRPILQATDWSHT
jgi:hypothetical protein